MSARINQITTKFASYGYTITVRTLDKSNEKLLLTALEEPVDGSLPRLEKLLEYYFTGYEKISERQYNVLGDNYSADGHGIIDICRRCGCVEMDACEDKHTGSCYWVEPDLCSACASEEELTVGRESMMRFFMEEDE